VINIKLHSSSSPILLIIIITLMLTLSCEKLITGYGPQPCYIHKPSADPKLNILGVLRPDSLNSKPTSFVHIEKSFPVTISEDSLEIKDADVTIYHYNHDELVDSIKFVWTDLDGTFKKCEYRNGDFFPLSGHTYKIKCRRDGYPELIGETTIPGKPVIIDGFEKGDEENLSFSILRDSLACVYDVYLLIGEKSYFKRIKRPDEGNVRVEFKTDIIDSEDSATILIYAYDLNLSEYITYNVGIKPNTYRDEYSTVINGYGCFGSINLLKNEIDLGSLRKLNNFKSDK